MKNNFLIRTAVLLLFACNKPVVKYNQDFEGRWRSLKPDTISGKVVQNEIVIEGEDGVYRLNCKSVCSENLCDCTFEQTGKAVVNTGKTHLKIGSANSSPMTIDEEPTTDSLGNQVMTIGGKTYKKQ